MTDKMTDSELETAITIYVKELAERDFKRARQLLTHLAVELIDKRLEKLE